MGGGECRPRKSKGIEKKNEKLDDSNFGHSWVSLTLSLFVKKNQGGKGMGGRGSCGLNDHQKSSRPSRGRSLFRLEKSNLTKVNRSRNGLTAHFVSNAL